MPLASTTPQPLRNHNHQQSQPHTHRPWDVTYATQHYHGHTKGTARMHAWLLMQFQWPSYPGARTHTTPLKTQCSSDMAPLPTMTQLHKDTGRNSLTSTRPKSSSLRLRGKDHALPSKTKITQACAHTRMHTHKHRHAQRSRHCYRIHKHTQGVTEKRHTEAPLPFTRTA